MIFSFLLKHRVVGMMYIFPYFVKHLNESRFTKEQSAMEIRPPQAQVAKEIKPPQKHVAEEIRLPQEQIAWEIRLP